MTKIRLVLLAIIVFAGGCSGARWTRVQHTDRSYEIDRTDCLLLAQRMSTERNDVTSSYSMGFFRLKEERRVSRDAIRLYFNECMYQRGWNRAAGLEKASANTVIGNGIYAVLDITVSDKDVVLADEKGSLYRIGARQLSPDIEVRLRGRKAGEAIEFDRETISTATVSRDRRSRGQVNQTFDKAPAAKVTIKVAVQELYEAN